MSTKHPRSGKTRLWQKIDDNCDALGDPRSVGSGLSLSSSVSSTIIEEFGAVQCKLKVLSA